LPPASSYASIVVPPGSVDVALGVCPMPHTFVHWSRDCVALAVLTTESEVPYQTATLGHGPWYPESAARTRSPRCAGDLLVAPVWQDSPLVRSVAHRYGMPATIAPPVNTSG